MPESSVDAQLATILGSVDHTTQVSELKRLIEQKGRFIERRLVEELERIVANPTKLQNERSRVLIARLLVALLPTSLPLIESQLYIVRLSENKAELQFSIFVALSDLPELLGESLMLSQITDLLRRYLIDIDTDAAQAAWMVGDLLGDHWPLTLALPVLIDSSKTAAHVAGRQGAIHGLSHALARASKLDQWKIVQALKDVAASDTNNSVRRSAELAMSDLRGL